MFLILSVVYLAVMVIETVQQLRCLFGALFFLIVATVLSKAPQKVCLLSTNKLCNTIHKQLEISQYMHMYRRTKHRTIVVSYNIKTNLSYHFVAICSTRFVVKPEGGQQCIYD